MKSGQRVASAESTVKDGPAGLSAGETPEVREAGAIPSILASVAHQMSQPLTALRGTLELALLKASSIREHRISEEKALAAAEELARILQGVRELAEAYTPVGESVPVELSELVREVVEDLRPVALSRRVAIQLDAVPGMDVLGDRPRLYGALLKLVHLAVERSSPRSGVRVSLRVAGEDAQIAVEDEGPHYPEGSRAGWPDLSLMTEAPEVIWELGAAAKMVESSGGLLTTEKSCAAGTPDPRPVAAPVGGVTAFSAGEPYTKTNDLSPISPLRASASLVCSTTSRNCQFRFSGFFLEKLRQWSSWRVCRTTKDVQLGPMDKICGFFAVARES